MININRSESMFILIYWEGKDDQINRQYPLFILDLFSRGLGRILGQKLILEHVMEIQHCQWSILQ